MEALKPPFFLLPFSFSFPSLYPYPSFLISLRPLLYPPLLISPSSYLPLSPHHFLAANIHSFQPLDGSKHLIICPARSPPSATWTLSYPLYFSISAGIKTFRPLVNCNPSSHVCYHLVYYSMPFPCSNMLICSALDLGSGSPEGVRILLNVVAGVEGGRLLGIPWKSLPLTHSFVKERLALAAFSNCHCSFPSASCSIGPGFGINIMHSGSLR